MGKQITELEGRKPGRKGGQKGGKEEGQRKERKKAGHTHRYDNPFKISRVVYMPQNLK